MLKIRQKLSAMRSEDCTNEEASCEDEGDRWLTRWRKFHEIDFYF